jgi:hypothetical protein
MSEIDVEFNSLIEAQVAAELQEVPNEFIAETMNSLATDVSIAAASDPLTPLAVAVMREAARRVANG